MAVYPAFALQIIYSIIYPKGVDIMADKKICCASLVGCHLLGMLTGAIAVCITACAIKKRKKSLADKAKDAFKTLEKTLSV